MPFFPAFEQLSGDAGFPYSSKALRQQRLARFLGEYQDFAKTLSESRPVLEGLSVYFSTPPPIS
jgi:hypothetical protein